MKSLTILGTRPEMIRMSRITHLLDRHTHHFVLHTGQNSTFELRDQMISDLGIRIWRSIAVPHRPLSAQIGHIFAAVEEALGELRPDAVFVLGDTNSSLSAIVAARTPSTVYHLEAGNRSFDRMIPEETNRRVIDHASDFNFVYTEAARLNLLSEGVSPKRIAKIGSPLQEVLSHYAPIAFQERHHLGELFPPGAYVLASIHRQENLLDHGRLLAIMDAIAYAGAKLNMPIVFPVHPKTKDRLKTLGIEFPENFEVLPPFGFLDYIWLQKHALCVVSDSGSVSEEAAILGFRSVTIRPSIERPEAQEAGYVILSQPKRRELLDAITLAASTSVPALISDYAIADTSARVLSFATSTYGQKDSTYRFD